jgi:hypothetical protein
LKVVAQETPMVSIEWHARLRRSPLTGWVIDLKEAADYFRWRRANVAGSTCALQKRRAILDLLRAHHLDLIVETGTFLGDTAAFLSRRGFEVVTIEIDAKLAGLARARFDGNKKVRLLEGDSSVLLPRIAGEIRRPALFYLDAHYSGPGTGMGNSETPISAEIEMVLARAPARSVVVIDDARCFGTAPDYPPLDEFLGALRARGVADAHVANDAIVFSVAAGSAAGAH